ncbi:hypothetical protein Desor_3769 [Desulfosporosinus orientis DSM 765]|uniref:DUF3574 domain-containing protein n=1 Tax=Desulfosporosinus orientis (strain ATCC 19365 / DSM 765 / NCIMB 8382 / VKM B-1628 / Singapore I) TaxID=768706 RepID=G7W6U9_DESOD|nr:DUF3574 domain-containing protein [Desulfosporosinus orientis]AET69231.1 hypothetical protein Desor_3769 [Desulfosporosinus orientis DSM 765]
MNKRTIAGVVVSILMLLMCAGCSAPASDRGGLAANTEVKYTLYVGLNDKDTYTQIIDSLEAEKKASAICIKYVDGYTLTHGEGAYKDEKGVITKENSLIYTFFNVTDAQMKSIMNEMLKELNQNSILIEKQKVNYDFYDGEKL